MGKWLVSTIEHYTKGHEYDGGCWSNFFNNSTSCNCKASFANWNVQAIHLDGQWRWVVWVASNIDCSYKDNAWFMSLFFIVDCFTRIENSSSSNIHCILSNLNQPPSNVKKKPFLARCLSRHFTRELITTFIALPHNFTSE